MNLDTKCGTRVLRFALLLVGLISGLGTAGGQSLFFVENQGAGDRVKTLAAGGASLYWTPPVAFPQITDLAADAQGRLYCALSNGQQSELHRVDAAGTASVVLLSGFGTPFDGLTVSRDGRLYFVEQFTNLVRINPDGTGFTTLSGSAVAGRKGVAVDEVGTVIFVETSFASFIPVVTLLEARGNPSYLTRAIHMSSFAAQIGSVHRGGCGRVYFDERLGGIHQIYRFDGTSLTSIATVATPESIGKKHFTTETGVTIFVVEQPVGMAGARDRIMATALGATVTLYQSLPPAQIRGVAYAPGPCATPTLASGTVGVGAGGPFDVLSINGSRGGPTREVAVLPFQSFSLTVSVPPSASQPPAFVLWGRLGRSAPQDSVPGFGGVGGLINTPCPLDPLNPDLFTFADSFGLGSSCLPVFSAGPAPWSRTLAMGLPPQLGFWNDIVIQGIMEDLSSPQLFAFTNAVVLRISTDP